MSTGFVTISDHRYFPGVQALVNSIHANSPAPVTVLDEGLEREQVAWLHAAGVETRRAARSIPVDDPRFGCCYALFDIDAAPYDRIICVDPDAIVLEDVRNLFRLLDDAPIVAASANLSRTLIDPGYRRKLRHAFPRNRARFLLKHPHHIINYVSHRYSALSTGTVAVRRELMPALRSAALRYHAFFEEFRLPDQDLLSLSVAYLGVDCLQLPYAFNAATLHASPGSALANEHLLRKYRWVSKNIEMEPAGGKLTIRPRVTGADAPERIRVLHYAGPDKPWKPDAGLRPGFREIWQHYHDAVSFAGSPQAR